MGANVGEVAGASAGHHDTTHKRWPLLVMGNAGGKLKTEGRFLRYAERGKTGWRSLADFFQTVGQAYGVPLPDFGVENGADPVKGPLTELLA